MMISSIVMQCASSAKKAQLRSSEFNLLRYPTVYCQLPLFGRLTWACLKTGSFQHTMVAHHIPPQLNGCLGVDPPLSDTKSKLLVYSITFH